MNTREYHDEGVGRRRSASEEDGNDGDHRYRFASILNKDAGKQATTRSAGADADRNGVIESRAQLKQHHQERDDIDDGAIPRGLVKAARSAPCAPCAPCAPVRATTETNDRADSGKRDGGK